LNTYPIMYAITQMYECMLERIHTQQGD
jgi:hypothetical protein